MMEQTIEDASKIPPAWEEQQLIACWLPCIPCMMNWRATRSMAEIQALITENKGLTIM